MLNFMLLDNSKCKTVSRPNMLPALCTKGRNQGSICQLKCRKGYRLLGPQKIRCTSGNFSPSPKRSQCVKGNPI